MNCQLDHFNFTMSIKWFTVLLFLSILSFISSSESERNITVQLFLKNVIEKNEIIHLKWIEIKSKQKNYEVELEETTREILTENIQLILDNGKSEALQGKIKTYQGNQNLDDKNSTLSIEISVFDKQIRGAVTLGDDTFDIVPSDITSGDQEVALKIHIAAPPGKCEELMIPNHHENDVSIDGGDIGHEISKNLHIAKREANFHIHNSEEENHFVELYVVGDNHFYKALGSSVSEATNYIIETINHVNAYFRQFHIHVSLVGLEIWTQNQKIVTSTKAKSVLDSFCYYRRANIKTRHDVAHLLTHEVFEENQIGLAYVAGMCSFVLGCGLTSIHQDKNPLTSGTIFAHELGHNLNLNHDKDSCQCQPHSSCLMSPKQTSYSIDKWSDCSTNSLKSSMLTPMSFCMKNRPNFGTSSPHPDCGNGIIDKGEECDPGERATSSKCCNPTTCKLQPNAQCASGACCDQSTCQLRPNGTLCSHKNSESNVCDFPEYCDGKSEFCPPDTYPAVGSKQCTSQGDYCYEKRCGSRTELCQKYYGSTSTEGPEICHQQNKEGAQDYGYCSYSIVENLEESLKYNFIPCSDSNYKCGVIHCHKYSESFPTTWNGANDWRLKLTNNQGYCFLPRFDTRLSQINDPGIGPNGATCGSFKICVDSVCKSVSEVQEVKCDCKNGSECNNLGHCHCPAGFRGPKCEEICKDCCGGSEDANYCIIGVNSYTKGKEPIIYIINDTISQSPNVFMNDKPFEFLGRLQLSCFLLAIFYQ